MPNRVSERIYLDQYLKAKGWALADDDVVPAAPPAPDFILRLPGGHRLGVEVTELAADDSERARGGSRMREDESFGNRWVRDLAAAHYDSGGAPITVQVSLRKTDPARPPAPTPDLRARPSPS